MMGRSIAAKVAHEGLSICLKEVSMERAERSRAQMEAVLDHDIARFSLTEAEKKLILSRIRWVTELECASECDLAIETVQEDFEVGLSEKIRGKALSLRRQSLGGQFIDPGCF